MSCHRNDCPPIGNNSMRSSSATERIVALRECICATVPEIFADRAELVTLSYQKTQGLPFVLRRAKALEAVLKVLEIYIRKES